MALVSPEMPFHSSGRLSVVPLHSRPDMSAPDLRRPRPRESLPTPLLVPAPSLPSSVREEYLALSAVVRAGVDTAKRARADGFRTRIEDLLASGRGARDGSARALRSALAKADTQLEMLRAEEKRVSRARARLRVIEDTYLIEDAPPEALELQRGREHMTRLRLQAYCALRSQLQVERAVGRLAGVLKELSALLGDLGSEYASVRGARRANGDRGTPVQQSGTESGLSTPSGHTTEADVDDDARSSHPSYEVIDGGSMLAPRARSDMPGTVREAQSTAHLWSLDRVRKPSESRATHRRYDPARYGSSESGRGGGSSRLLRVSLWARPAARSTTRPPVRPTRYNRTDSDVDSLQNSQSEDASDTYAHSASSRRASATHARRRPLSRFRALSRFALARVRLPSAAKSMWLEADARYQGVLKRAPHLIEQRLVPIESIEGGILGQWPERERTVPGAVRVERMKGTVAAAVEAVAAIAAWQSELVETIRADYRKNRDALREAELKISDLYFRKLTGGGQMLS